MPQLFCAVKTVLSRRLGMGRESHLYLSRSHVNGHFSYRLPYVLREYVHMGGTPQCPRPLVSMMVRKGRLGTSSLGVNIRG
jgi:hypothetical protein